MSDYVKLIILMRITYAVKCVGGSGLWQVASVATLASLSSPYKNGEVKKKATPGVFFSKKRAFLIYLYICIHIGDAEKVQLGCRVTPEVLPWGVEPGMEQLDGRDKKKGPQHNIIPTVGLLARSGTDETCTHNTVVIFINICSPLALFYFILLLLPNVNFGTRTIH